MKGISVLLRESAQRGNAVLKCFSNHVRPCMPIHRQVMLHSIRYSSSDNRKPNIQDLGEAFEIIARSRYAERNFANHPIPPAIIKKILELTLLAPSSFNLQPYKMLIVQEENAKLDLSTAMLGGNGHIVSTAPTTVVFLADKGK